MEAPELKSTAQQPEGTRLLVARLRSSQGVRDGMILALATLVMNGSAYLYNVACIRYLGSRAYGDIAAVLALGALVALPLGSFQIVIAREVAHRGSSAATAELLRRVMRKATLAGFSLFLIGVIFVAPIQRILNVESRAAVLVGLTGIVVTILAAGLFGILQGALRFKALGMTYGVGGLSRLFLVVPALLLGFGVVGALAVNTIAGALVVALGLIALRDLLRMKEGSHEIHFDRREVIVMLAGSLAFASLTNVDIILAAYFLPGDVAGVYAAAALVGKAVLFLPAAIVTVLLPKAAVRTAAGISPHKILLASAGVTLLITLPATVALALVPESVLVWAFGGDYREATDLLGLFGLAMTAAALVNVYLSVYFAQRDSRFPMLVGAAAVAQVLVVGLWHPDSQSIVVVTLACCTTVLAIHEIAFPLSLRHLLRGGVSSAVMPSEISRS